MLVGMTGGLILALAAGATSTTAMQTPEVRLWRIDCGEMAIANIGYFSDSFAYEGQSATISNGCYLVQHNDQFLLWDAGLPAELLGNTRSDGGWTSSISATIELQLSELDIEPGDIDYVAISHYHGDHIGQAAVFPDATLVLSERDHEQIKAMPSTNVRRRLSPWFEGDAKVLSFAGDLDVFGDGTVTILAMPGHTPGHGALLVRLQQTGPILLTGDLYHFRSEIGSRIVSRWNTSRADTLASYERFAAIVSQIDPVVIVQHDPSDIDKLPHSRNTRNDLPARRAG